MSDPVEFIPAPDRVKAATSYPTPYDFAWEASHAGGSLTEAINSVRDTLGVAYDMASSLVWAEMSSQTPRRPAA
jgi:hypothetical protein